MKWRCHQEIQEHQPVNSTGRDGPPVEETKIEIEMHDKKGALDLQARIAGMLRDVKVNDYSNYTLNMYFGAPPAKREKDISPPVVG